MGTSHQPATPFYTALVVMALCFQALVPSIAV